MAEKLVIGPINKGLRTDREPFVIDNDSFPTLVNAYQWRGRVKRKRGTKLVNRLNRYYSSGASTLTLSSGSQNLITGFSLESTGTIYPGTVIITDTVTGLIYTDPNSDGKLYNVTASITGASQATDCVLTAANNFPAAGSVKISGVGGMVQLNSNTYTIISDNSSSITINVNSTGFTAYTSGGLATFVNTAMTPAPVAGSINYSTGAFTIIGAGTDTVTAIFYYYPGLPVMGLRDFVIEQMPPPDTIGFDTTYSYEVGNTYSVGGEINIWDVSFYKNPSTGPSGYVPKTTWTPLTWSGANYQQFWTTNFAGAMWTTNGKPGMQVQKPSAASRTSATVMVFSLATSPAVIGDFVFVNEWTAQNTPANANTLNFQTGYVTAITPGTSITVKFPNANIANDTYSGGMVQYLTTRSDTNSLHNIDGIRWFDGDPTAGGTYPPSTSQGWVNYAPPLSFQPFSIDNSLAAQYYLVGATMIYPFRDFLIFVGPYIQTTSGQIANNPPIWLQDTIIYAQNGTPFYTASFSGSAGGTVASFGTIVPILVPTNQTATPYALWEDVSGFGGYISSGVSQPILTLVPNEDVLILGYPKAFTRLIYTGNNLIPFLFYRINTELGASSTFSAITFDKGSFTLGNFGFAMTTQVASQRIDLQIPDSAFQVNYANNGANRICAGRNYFSEWVYVTYCSNSNPWVYPNQTLMYNYRDDSWALLNETYTCYGNLTIIGGLTWEAETRIWVNDNDTWNADPATIGSPNIIAGNQQGFVLVRDVGTGEGASTYVSNINTSTGVVTSPNHGFNYADPGTGASNYVVFSNVNGSVTDENGNSINGNIYEVEVINNNTFTTNPMISSGTYTGGGIMTRAYVPLIQSKQFPLSWSASRKTTLGVQQYLFSRTPNAEITLNIYLSTDPTSVYNDLVTNNAMIYSQVLYTCQESTNLGLTAANTNLLQINQISQYGQSSNNQSQIWHRMNTSLLGDTVQFGFTISPQQMLSSVYTVPFNITGATQANPCVLTCSSDFEVGQVITINGVEGMIYLNGNDYVVLAVTSTTVTINVDSRLYPAYTMSGTAQLTIQNNQFAEIEFHSAILEIKPSGFLA